MEKKNPVGVMINTASDAAQFVTRGFRNNNPGNIRISGDKWVGKLSPNTDGSFEQFSAPEYGIRALSKLLDSYAKKYGDTNIESIIARYAPSNENDTNAYINSVVKTTGIHRAAPLVYPRDKEKTVRAIIKHENGFDPYTDEVMKKGLSL